MTTVKGRGRLLTFLKDYYFHFFCHKNSENYDNTIKLVFLDSVNWDEKTGAKSSNHVCITRGNVSLRFEKNGTNVDINSSKERKKQSS